MVLYWVVKWEDQFTPLDTACRQLRQYRFAEGWMFGRYSNLLYRVYDLGDVGNGKSLYMRGDYSTPYALQVEGYGFNCDGITCGIWVVRSTVSGSWSYMLTIPQGYAVHVGKNRYVGPKLEKPF